MNLQQLQPLIEALLYEGYILYPYRPSAIKNRQRWSFGAIYPQHSSLVADGSERCSMQTQCLLQGKPEPDTDAALLEVHVRFLHLLQREVGELLQPLAALPADSEPALRIVPMLTIDDQQFHRWQEAVERDVAITGVTLNELLAAPRRITFAFPGQRRLEALRTKDGTIAGVLIRSQRALQGEVELSAEILEHDLARLSVVIRNTTALPTSTCARDEALLHTFASTHTILGSDGAGFVSLLEPPAALQEAAAACSNTGTWPVLIGTQGQCDTMLSSPIILYDYPQLAPESPGDLFDGTEIDEILTLRILTMTAAEKHEMAAVDPRARALLERTENLGMEQLQQLHGTLRNLRPRGHQDELPPVSWEEYNDRPQLTFLRIGDVELKVGDPVRLRPRPGGDIMDLALAGKNATIEAIERDFEDRVHVAVTIDDDPGRDLGLARMPGHRFFFYPEEIEPLGSDETTS
jgi:hypothetical protein